MGEAHKLSKTKQIKEVQLDFWTGNQQAESFFLKNGFDHVIQKMKK